METIRTVRCDDCPYNNRYLGDKAFTRALGHAKSNGHRVMVLDDEEDAIYDYRPTEESDTGSVE